MSETYIVTAKTIDEAIAIANKEYADAEHEISYDILEMPKKGFLGIGAKDAKLKVTVNEIRDADLDSIVSDLRSMKIHTDKSGRDDRNKSGRGPRDNVSRETSQADSRTQGDSKTQADNRTERGKNSSNHGAKPQRQQNNQPKPKPETAAAEKAEKPEKQNQRPPRAEKQNNPANAASQSNQNQSGAGLPKQQKKETKPEQQVQSARSEKANSAAKDLSKTADKLARADKAENKADNAPASDKPVSRKAEQKPRPERNNQPKQSEKPEKTEPSNTNENAEANVNATSKPEISDVLPKEHSEVIVSAPVGLYDIPAHAGNDIVNADAEVETEPEDAEEESIENAKDSNVKIAVSEAEMEYALEFANTLLRNMKIDAKAERGVCPEGETYETSEDASVYPKIEIVGNGTGILIGHHGETLDAIQYLVNLSAVRRAKKTSGHGDYVKIVVDVENYRTKREETLRALARRMAARAVKLKKNVFLEPMNAYERRIIHSELQTYENVSTHSVGTDKNRKIIITYEGPDKQPAPQKNRKPRPKTADSAETAPALSDKAKEPRERPRPKKPQKMPIEKLPDFLSSSSTEPDEVLSIED